MTPNEKARAEAWLCRRLAEHGSPVASGVEALEAQVRQAIESGQLESVVVGRGSDRKPFTYSQALERLYGAPVASPPRANREPDMSARGKSSRRSKAYEELPA
jgi:hypothetical protein